MTVCVAVKVHDCIVFAADSATSLSAVDGAGNQVIINIYENANKVFNLHKGLPICAMTAGIGNFGPSSISTMSKDLRRLFASDDPEWKLERENYTIEEVAQKAAGSSSKSGLQRLIRPRRARSTTGSVDTRRMQNSVRFGGFKSRTGTAEPRFALLHRTKRLSSGVASLRR